VLHGGLAFVEALIVSTGSLLVLFVGFSLLFSLPVFRSRRRSQSFRSLDDRLGTPVVYLAAEAPRGPVDQLHTPELLETEPRKFA
jgi:hypothetical protein